MRESGILLPVSSLPSRYGIGCLSQEAYEFIRILKAAGQSYWQVLPLGPTGYGDSPYQSFSTFAGNPYFIDFGELIAMGLLGQEECAGIDFGSDPSSVDYGKIYEGRWMALHVAYQRYVPKEDYRTFCSENAWWLDDYALYMALKDAHRGAGWTQWEEPYRNRHPQALERARSFYKREVDFYRFVQYMFRHQWDNVHAYAASQGIEIIGDIPFYVAFDSADTWANPELFQFDKNREPIAVAGCPPDAFSATGQLWGNPLYDWAYHRSTGYEWWTRRVKASIELYDIVRIDHFRGFDEYYSIPAGDPTAEFGHWEKGPGIELFTVMRGQLGKLPVIAEDLGYLTDSVRALLKETGFPGMKVLQFAFDPSGTSDYLPHNYDKNCVVYIGTHDNDTTRGWYETMPEADRAFCVKYMGNADTPSEKIVWDFIRMAQSSVADLCIIPLQDYLNVGSEGRINLPSSFGTNWKWRATKEQMDTVRTELVQPIYEMTKLYGRLPKEKKISK